LYTAQDSASSCFQVFSGTVFPLLMFQQWH
jgi:hypothetical protein